MFSTLTKLLEWQIPAVAKMLPIRVGGLFMDLGTGKSRTLLEIAALRQGRWDKLFWFTPCSLRWNVRRQILEHTDIPVQQICLWDTRTMDKGVDLNAFIHIIGLESMGSSTRTVLAYSNLVTTRSFVAVDESAYIKGYLANRTQRITRLSAKAHYRIVLTGMPFSQCAVDLFSQMTFLSDKILGYKSFWKFAANHLEYEERRASNGLRVRTGRIVHTHNTEYLAAKIAPYVYQVKKNECMDLPEKLYERFWLNMTDDQCFFYDQAKREFLETDFDDWSSIAIFRLFSRLQRIVCGFATVNGKQLSLRHNRIKILMTVINSIPTDEKIIIWGKYRDSVEEICKALTEAYGESEVCPYYGGISEKQREYSLARWRGNARFLVPTQSLASHGLTLVESANAIFYADSFKYAERVQAEDRMHRYGQTRRPVYASLSCEGTIDERINAALERKGNALADFEDEIAACRTQGLREKAVELVRAL